MAQPVYTLNVENFDALLAARGFKNRSAFVEATGFPRRTLQSALAGNRDLTLVTVAALLDAFPGTSFEYLFDRVTSASGLKIVA